MLPTNAALPVEFCSPHRIVCPWCARTQQNMTAEVGELVVRCENVRCKRHLLIYARAGAAGVTPVSSDDAAALVRHRERADQLRIATDAYLRGGMPA